MSRWLTIVLVPLLLLTSAAPAGAAIKPLPVGPDVDYQLGGVRSVPERVGIVVRDRTAKPLAGHYNICYVNGFQTQADETPLLAASAWAWSCTGAVDPVVDSAWGEWLLDIRTASKRTRLARIMTAWTRGCARSGFDAVEFDNLDSYTRSHRLLTRSQAIVYARLLVTRAHRAGLAAGQKNLADFNGRRVGYDFAVAEECGRYRECGDYTDELRPSGARRSSTGAPTSMDLLPLRRPAGRRTRDLALSPRGVRAWC